MTLRSLLFIPGDSDKKLAKVAGCGADAVILDLEDAVALSAKPAARTKVADFLHAFDRDAPGAPELWVRVNPLGSGMMETDLAAVVPFAPAGIMQPKADGPDCVAKLSDLLDHMELAHGRKPGSIGIIPLVSETAISPFRLGDYAAAGLTRMRAMTWGAEDLAAALGATGNRGPDGEWLFTYRLVRSMVLMAAHAAGVPAIETLQADFRDEAGLAASSRQARAEGFSGRLAIHPAQVGPINDSFTPSAEELAFAQKVVDAFAAEPGAGVVGLEGKMLDVPHLRAARRTLGLPEA
ncbi:HpcH/HpaI aldolase/citrate lyase family protein [Tsuneonella amylolytica]|uniref:HpcH/HpaI aldolase/citrate lyase family protein n=1 Tax=Tsuneonella amylolytica TaxID=2338327 RepID=UPI000EA8E701|nr:CoA ester lyase [Tsuneonella amylolytica]